MTTYLAESTDLAAVADAIRAKGGTTASLAFPSGFVSAISAIETGGGGYTIDDIAERNMMSGAIVGSSASFIGSYVFYDCSRLTSASFPACMSIGGNAFQYCSSLATVDFSACMSIGGNAFYGCSRLTSASFPAATNIANSAFYSCTRLATVDFPACTNIASYAFQYCSSLATASFPACTNIGGNAFAYCTSLATVDFASTVNMIGSYAFRSCRMLVSLYLTGVSKVPTLSASAFLSTPIGGYSASAGQYGSVFVPSSLYASFLTAANWSSIAARIVSV